jgi:hypothetical protein
MSAASQPERPVPERAPGTGAEGWVVAVMALALVGALALLTPVTLRISAGLGPDATEYVARSAARASVQDRRAGAASAFAPHLADDAWADAGALAAASQQALAALPDPARLAATATGPVAARAEVPPVERWQIEFPAGLTEAEYATALDALGLELAVLGADGQLEYVAGVSQLSPTRRQGPAADEARFYLTWTRGDLLAADRNLLTKSGLPVEAQLILHFLSATAESRLVELERSHAGRSASEVLRTRFGVRPSNSGFEFYVVEQVPRG